MLRKILVSLVVFLIVGGFVCAAGFLVDERVELPQTIASDSPCPAVGCASGTCHGFDDVPDPDGIHSLECPEISCSSLDCHAWDTLNSRYHRASDASLNLWILAPVLLVLGLIILVRKL